MAPSNLFPNVTLYNAPYGIQGPAGPAGPTGDTILTTNINFGSLGVTVSNVLDFILQAGNYDMGTIIAPNSTVIDEGLL
jgi:hypothetical protein